MMGPGAGGGGKDLGGFMKSFAGNLGGQMSGLGNVGGPMSGIGMMKQMMGGGGGPADEQNPGAEMFGAKKDKAGFFEKFGGNLSDELFKRAMMGFMGGNG
jgi:hypothetical protein